MSFIEPKTASKQRLTRIRLLPISPHRHECNSRDTRMPADTFKTRFISNRIARYLTKYTNKYILRLYSTL